MVIQTALEQRQLHSRPRSSGSDCLQLKQLGVCEQVSLVVETAPTPADCFDGRRERRGVFVCRCSRQLSKINFGL